MEPGIFFTLVYTVIAICFILSPKEFETAGLTIQTMFSSYLGSEDFDFILYHVRRTTVTVLVHSFIPLGRTFLFPVSLNHWTLFNSKVTQKVPKKV